MNKERLKKPEWRISYDKEFPTFGRGFIRVYRDWISYNEIGFNPKTSIKDVLREYKEKIDAIKEGYEKWQKEFNK